MDNSKKIKIIFKEVYSSSMELIQAVTRFDDSFSTSFPIDKPRPKLAYEKLYRTTEKLSLILHDKLQEVEKL